MAKRRGQMVNTAVANPDVQSGKPSPKSLKQKR
jgi:hypothetical protein